MPLRQPRMPHRQPAVAGRHARAGQARCDASPARVGRVGWRRLPSSQRPRRLLPRGGMVFVGASTRLRLRTLRGGRSRSEQPFL